MRGGDNDNVDENDDDHLLPIESGLWCKVEDLQSAASRDDRMTESLPYVMTFFATLFLMLASAEPKNNH